MLSKEDHTRALELLADRATQGLEPEETRELEELLRRDPRLDDSSFERCVAAIALTLVDPSPEPLPSSLRQRMEIHGRRVMSHQGFGRG